MGQQLFSYTHLSPCYNRNADQTFDRHTKRAGYGDQTGKFIPGDGE